MSLPSPTTQQGRLWASAGLSLLIHGALALFCAVVAINFVVPSPEFVELNVGRFTQQQLARIIHDQERVAEASSPDRRAQTPTKRLPKIDMPTIRPTEMDRMLLPEQVALEEDKASVPPLRPASPPVLPLPVSTSDRKVLYEGTQIDLGPRPGEGIESEHVGSDIQPVFLIEGELRGRRFHEAAVTQAPEVPAQTKIQLDVTVAPSGAIISAIVVRREIADLEDFAVSYLRRSRFDPLPADVPQMNQTGRITITFAARR